MPLDGCGAIQLANNVLESPGMTERVKLVGEEGADRQKRNKLMRKKQSNSTIATIFKYKRGDYYQEPGDSLAGSNSHFLKRLKNLEVDANYVAQYNLLENTLNNC